LKSKAEEFRQHAIASLQVAQRMSGFEDRKRMMEMAQQWLRLAQEAEIGPATVVTFPSPTEK
jgi:hypothetical protein